MTYGLLAALFLLPPVLVTVLAVVVRRPGPRWWAITGATITGLLLLTIVFDTAMIAADLFRYDEDQLSGVLIGIVPWRTSPGRSPPDCCCPRSPCCSTLRRTDDRCD